MTQPKNAITQAISRQAMFLISFTLLVYAQAISFPFLHLDDTVYIVSNDEVHHWSDIPSYFTGNAGEHFFAHGAPLLRNLYRPMVGCWVLLNYKLFGTQAALWHLSAIAMYVLGVWLFWRMAWRLSKNDFVALAAALIYALHPLHAEGVCWLSGACVETLLAVFFFGGFIAYLRWRESQKTAWLLACAVLTLLAFLSKETAAALPVLIIAHALLFPSTEHQAQDRSIRFFWLNLTMVATTALYALLRFAAIHAVVISYAQRNWADISRTAPLLFVTQLKHAFWPLHLGPWYDVPIITTAKGADFYLPLAICIAYVALTVWSLSRKPLVAFLLLWWAVTLGPAIVGSVIQPDSNIVQDRFTFTALAGFSIVVALLLARLPNKSGRLIFGFNATASVAALLIAAVLGVLSTLQVGVWKSDLAMLSHAIEVTPTSVRPRVLLGAEYLKLGDPTRSVAAYRSAVDLAPNRWEILYSYGVALASDGHRPEAIVAMQRAMQANPVMTPPYLIAADLLVREGRLDEAITTLEHGVPIAREPEILRHQLAQLLWLRQGRARKINQATK